MFKLLRLISHISKRIHGVDTYIVVGTDLDGEKPDNFVEEILGKHVESFDTVHAARYAAKEMNGEHGTEFVAKRIKFVFVFEDV